jgi:hypothetical protein
MLRFASMIKRPHNLNCWLDVTAVILSEPWSVIGNCDIAAANPEQFLKEPTQQLLLQSFVSYFDKLTN